MNTDQKAPEIDELRENGARDEEEEKANSFENGDEETPSPIGTSAFQQPPESPAPAPILHDRASSVGVMAPDVPTVPYRPYQPRARIDGTTYLAAIIAAPFQLAGGVLHGFGAHLSSWMERKSTAAPAAARAEPKNDVSTTQTTREAAKVAVVEAAITSKDVVRDAERFRTEWPAFGRLYGDMEAAARPEGKVIADIVREMKPGGTHHGLWSRFSEMLSEDREFAAAHGKLKANLDRHRSAWERAAVAVEAAGGDGNELWGRLDQSTTAIISATQGIPADAGMSFADRVKEIFDNIKEFFCRVFRLTPTVEPSAGPSARKTR